MTAINFVKRITWGLSVALLILVVGLSSTLLWKGTSTLPYCEVARNAELYHGQVITVRARVIFGSEGMYVFEECDPVAALASGVEFDGVMHSQTTGTFVEEVLVDGNRNPTQQAEAIIAGRFNGEFSRGCWGPAFKIAATKIELVSPVTEYAPIPSAEPGMRTRH